jgi:hypothetical protein
VKTKLENKNAVTLDAVVTAIKSLESNKTQLEQLARKVTKDLTSVSMMVFSYCSTNGKGAQARIAKQGISSSAVSRYYAVGQILSKIKSEILVKNNITPNDINNSLSRNAVKVSDLESVKNVSDLKRALSPKHPSKAKKTQGTKPSKPSSHELMSLKDLTNQLVDLAHLGKLTQDTWADLVAKVETALEDAKK